MLVLMQSSAVDSYSILSVLDHVAPRIPLRMQVPGITDICVYIGSFHNFPS